MVRSVADVPLTGTTRVIVRCIIVLLAYEHSTDLTGSNRANHAEKSDERERAALHLKPVSLPRDNVHVAMTLCSSVFSGLAFGNRRAALNSFETRSSRGIKPL